MAIGTGGGVGSSEELVCLTFVDICRNTYCDRFVHRQQEGNDTITTETGCEGVGIGTSFEIANTIKEVV